jgi:hypothetical protein
MNEPSMIRNRLLLALSERYSPPLFSVASRPMRLRSLLPTTRLSGPCRFGLTRTK